MLTQVALASTMREVWLLGLVLQVLLVSILLGKGRWRAFPAFLLYIAFNLLEAAVGYLAKNHFSVYLYVYVIGETIAVILGLAVFYEIFNGLLRAHPALRRIAILFFITVFLVLFVLAFGVIAANSPLSGKHVMSAVLVVEEAARIFELGMLIFLFSFSTIFGLHWRQPVFGIALGLGIFTVVKLVEVTLLPHAGPAQAALQIAGLVTFDLSVFVWLGYMLAPERIDVAELPQRAQLEQWNRAVMELIHQ